MSLFDDSETRGALESFGQQISISREPDCANTALESWVAHAPERQHHGEQHHAHQHEAERAESHAASTTPSA